MFSTKLTSALLLSASLLLIAMVSPVNGQRGRRDNSALYGRNSNVMKETLGDLAAASQRATCQIRDGRTNLVLGTVFSSDGWIVSKNSEIQNVTDLKCIFGDGSEFPAKVIATYPQYDLALLKVAAKNLVSVKVDQETIDVKVGQIVVSCDQEGKAISMGLVTAKPRKFVTRQRPLGPSRGFLGVLCRPSDEGLVIRAVTERSGAQRAGLERGDVILKMEGKKVATMKKLVAILTDYQPNQKVQISVARGGESLDLKATLGRNPKAQTDENDQWGGGPFSDRRYGFPKVIPHDSVIQPQQCGGPLLNSDGQVIGVNIARAFRVASYAVPVQVVKDFVKQNKVLAASK